MENMNGSEIVQKRQVTLTVVTGIIFMLLGEPYMASCSAGFTAGLIALITAVISSVASGAFVSLIPDVILVLLSGFVFNRFIRNLQGNFRKTVLASLLFLVSCGASRVKDILLNTALNEQLTLQGLYTEYIKQNIYDFLLAFAFFILFVALKIYVIDKKIAQDA